MINDSFNLNDYSDAFEEIFLAPVNNSSKKEDETTNGQKEKILKTSL